MHIITFPFDYFLKAASTVIFYHPKRYPPDFFLTRLKIVIMKSHKDLFEQEISIETGKIAKNVW